MDRYDTEQRSRIMARIGSKHTEPELLLRSSLHKLGLRYRLHTRHLPGSPDLVFPRFGAVIFVHGCYWHSHGCYRSTVPQSRQEFWREKFSANRKRDRRNVTELLESGWRVLIVWECALKGKTSYPSSVVAERVGTWLKSSEATEEIAGRSSSDDRPLNAAT